MVNDSAVVVFDDERAVANAGVMLPAALATRLGIALNDRPITWPSPALGADSGDDCDVLRPAGPLTCSATRSRRRGHHLA